MPKLTIVIGANGAGKSTWCEWYREELPTNFYNADSIARGLGDWNSARKQREARELVDHAIEDQLAVRGDFGFESTYSGRSRPSIVRRAKAFGYEVSAVFVGTRGPEINVDRVKARVADRSGHDVPKIEIRRRWTAAQENLIATSDAIDSIQLIDNSGSRARRVTTITRNQQTEVATDAPRWARDLARRITRAPRMRQAVPWQAFWFALAKRLEETKSAVRARKPQPENWMEFGIGRSQFFLGGWLKSTENEQWVGVYLRMGGPHATAHFELLRRQREEIEQALGRLDWRAPTIDRREPIVQLLRRDADPSQQENWPNQIDWMVSTLEGFDRTFGPRLRSLDASDWRPDDLTR